MLKPEDAETNPIELTLNPAPHQPTPTPPSSGSDFDDVDSSYIYTIEIPPNVTRLTLVLCTLDRNVLSVLSSTVRRGEGRRGKRDDEDEHVTKNDEIH